MVRNLALDFALIYLDVGLNRILGLDLIWRGYSDRPILYHHPPLIGLLSGTHLVSSALIGLQSEIHPVSSAQIGLLCGTPPVSSAMIGLLCGTCPVGLGSGLIFPGP